MWLADSAAFAHWPIKSKSHCVRLAANAVSLVDGEQLNRVPTPTIENALQGKIAGAVITTNSGAPGGGAQVQLRGVTSIIGSFAE